jgi:hypothetical protein
MAPNTTNAILNPTHRNAATFLGYIAHGMSNGAIAFITHG